MIKHFETFVRQLWGCIPQLWKVSNSRLFPFGSVTLFAGFDGKEEAMYFREGIMALTKRMEKKFGTKEA